MALNNHETSPQQPETSDEHDARLGHIAEAIRLLSKKSDRAEMWKVVPQPLAEQIEHIILEAQADGISPDVINHMVAGFVTQTFTRRETIEDIAPLLSGVADEAAAFLEAETTPPDTTNNQSAA